MEPAPHFTLGLRCAATEDRAINRWHRGALDASLCRRPRAKGTMRGTILCWVQDSVNGRAALKAANNPSEIILYPDTPHGFYADYRPSYRKDKADDGWKRLLAWFKTHGVA